MSWLRLSRLLLRLLLLRLRLVLLDSLTIDLLRFSDVRALELCPRLRSWLRLGWGDVRRGDELRPLLPWLSALELASRLGDLVADFLGDELPRLLRLRWRSFELRPRLRLRLGLRRCDGWLVVLLGLL